MCTVVDQIVIHEERPDTPPSPAVTAATKQVSPTSTSQDLTNEAQADEAFGDDSVAERESTSASTEEKFDQAKGSARFTNESHLEGATVAHQQNQGPVRESKTSPAASPMRPEDSIEAIDRFEEEMEKVGDLMPTVKKNAQTPRNSTRPHRTTDTAKTRTDSKSSSALRAKNGPAPKRTGSGPDARKKAFTKGAAVVVTASVPSEETKTANKTHTVSDSYSTSEVKTSVAAKKRVSSIHKAPFVPAKSTKPPTRASFELPGEAVARRLREAREERMKRDEEGKEAPRKATFKARPVRLSQPPVVKATATSRARISMAKGETPAAVAATNEATPKSKPKLAQRASGIFTANTGKRLSTLSVNKRPNPASANTPTLLNRSAPTTASNNGNATKSRLSTQPSVRQSIAPTDAAQLKAKGKEVFNRGHIDHDEREKMKKDKEEAAKKARAQAAERGRKASREWAEKQKAKKMAEKKGGVDVVGAGPGEAQMAA